MIDLRRANHIHDKLIDEFGGSKGIRDLGGLESALCRPYATFDGNNLYPTAIEPQQFLRASLSIILLLTVTNESLMC